MKCMMSVDGSNIVRVSDEKEIELFSKDLDMYLNHYGKKKFVM